MSTSSTVRPVAMPEAPIDLVCEGCDVVVNSTAFEDDMDTDVETEASVGSLKEIWLISVWTRFRS